MGERELDPPRGGPQGSVYGFAPVVALEATGSVLSAEGHASGRGPGPVKALGVLKGPSRRAVFQTDGLRRTADGRRIIQRFMQAK